MLSHVCSRTLARSLWSGNKSKGTTQNQIHVEGRITCGRQGLPLGICEKFSSQTGQNICACLVQQLPRLIGLGCEYQRHEQGQARGRHHIRGLKKPWCNRRELDLGNGRSGHSQDTWTWKASIILYHKLILLPQLLKLGLKSNSLREDPCSDHPTPKKPGNRFFASCPWKSRPWSSFLKFKVTMWSWPLWVRVFGVYATTKMTNSCSPNKCLSLTELPKQNLL